MSSEKKVSDIFQRGKKGFDAVGSWTMTVGRFLDIPLQNLVLFTPFLNPFFNATGLIRHPVVAESILQAWTGTIPISRLLLLATSTITALKQVHWAWNISLEPFSLQSAFQVSAINVVADTVLATVYLARATSSAAAGEQLTLSMVVASSLVVLGALIETISETQRRRFKDDDRNKGKLYTGGLFRYARHINYAGFIMARVGHAALASGWILGGIFGALFINDLGVRAAGILNKYCGDRYGEQWATYKRNVPYKLIPGVF